MPSRIIREGILTSERVNAVSAHAELFYRRLMSVVDDYGRFSGNLSLLRASCYPLKLDNIKEDAIKKQLSECVEAGLIVTYSINNKPFLELTDFRQQIRAKESKYPAADSQLLSTRLSTGSVCKTDDNQLNSKCVADAKQMHSTCIVDAKQMKSFVHLDEDVVVDGNEVVDDKKTRVKRAVCLKKTLLPDHFSISENVKQWAKSNGYDRLEQRLEHFIGYAKARAATYADWDQAFMNSIRSDWASLSKKPVGTKHLPINNVTENEKARALIFGKPKEAIHV